MNSKTIITLLLVGAAIVLVPPLIEFWSAQNTQNNLAKIMIEKPEITSVNLEGFKLDESLRYLLFWLGVVVLTIGIGFMWRMRKLNQSDRR